MLGMRRCLHAASQPHTIGLTLRVSDRFGDYGLVSVLVAIEDPNAPHTLEIDTWLMSCRVIGRTLEQLVFRELVARAERLGYRRLIGEYVATAKNALVAGLYSELGFAPLGAGRHALELPAPSLPRTFVAVE